MERARTKIERLAHGDRNVFWLGFVAGQAEKVWLGACPAMMVRPGADEFEHRSMQVAKVAKEYGLQVTTIGGEIWVHRAGFCCGRWLSCVINSPTYHRLRAEACGIKEVDEKYHERT